MKNPIATSCPVCKAFTLVSVPGTQLDPTDGVSVYCNNQICLMADWGHGKNVDAALKIFLQKCGKEN